MRGSSPFSIFLIMLAVACVDRVNINTGAPAAYPIVIDGFISDQPGPYTINITQAFDIESKLSTKVPLTVQQLVISDDHGANEVLSQTSVGVYQTNPAGIRGTLGHVYKIKITLLDGRIYESLPDTLLASGKVDSVYFNFRTDQTADGVPFYGFDVFFNSSANEKSDFHFMWQFVGTFRVDTNPEQRTQPCGESRCPSPPLCSGYTAPRNVLTKVGPCTCCTCWTKMFNNDPVVSDNQVVKDGRFTGVKASYVPVTGWTFMYKVYAEVDQMSLSRQSFDFWKEIKAQKAATNSLFQPVTGKIASNFIQISGTQAAIEGLFYATSITSKAVYITRDNVPKGLIPDVGLPFQDSCLELFPNSTTTRPSFWVD